jgi:hypothetical protein
MNGVGCKQHRQATMGTLMATLLSLLGAITFHINGIEAFQLHPQPSLPTSIITSSTSWVHRPAMRIIQPHRHHPTTYRTTQFKPFHASSFSDLNGEDHDDEGFMIKLMDSLTSSSDAPATPPLTEEEDSMLDDMVERFAIPLKELKRKVDGGGGGGDDGKVVSGVSGSSGGGESKATSGGDMVDDMKIVMEDSSSDGAKKVGDAIAEKAGAITVILDDDDVPSEKPAMVDAVKEAPEPETIAASTEDATTYSSSGSVDEQASDATDVTAEEEEGNNSISTPSTTTESTDNSNSQLIKTVDTSSSLSQPQADDFNPADFGIVGGITIGITLYLALAAYLKRVESTDKGYAEWDQFKKKQPEPPEGFEEEIVATKKEVIKLNADVSVVKEETTCDDVTPPVLVDEFTQQLPIQDAEIETRDEEAQLRDNTEEMENEISAQLDRLSQMEDIAASVNAVAASVDVENIAQYCEPKNISPECSQSISNYLDNLSASRVEEGTKQVAATKIISYLDSLSSDGGGSTRGNSYGVGGGIAKKEPTSTGAAFSSYLDAISTGSVSPPASAQAVAGYLGELSASAPASTPQGSTQTSSANSATAQKIGNRIMEVEERLNRLESSVSSLPDDIASRLITWQTRQDQRLNDEMEKISKYLLNARSKEDEEGR